METKDRLYLVLTFIIAISVFYCVMYFFADTLDEISQKNKLSKYENFGFKNNGGYYKYDWNKPGELTKLNNSILSLHKLKECPDCKYSEACHLTDNSLPNCFQSLDVPTFDIKNNILRTNSY